MKPLPTEDMRSNLGTWAVPVSSLPALGHWMHDALPNEPFDPHFLGQKICTYYFDTQKLLLRKARLKSDQYCTLRLREYPNETYAISAKTESQKFRLEVTKLDFKHLGTGKDGWQNYLPPDILARLIGIIGDEPLVIASRILTKRYAIEDDEDRFTLDTSIITDTGKRLEYSILEFKSTKVKTAPSVLFGMGLFPIKISKFLWSTEI